MYLASACLELLLQEIVVRWLPSEAVPYLRHHHRDTTGCYQVSDPVHSWPRKARPALPRVSYLLQDFVPFAGRVLPQGFHLLSKGIATLRLLFGGHASVEYRPLRVVTVGARHCRPPSPGRPALPRVPAPACGWSWDELPACPPRSARSSAKRRRTTHRAPARLMPALVSAPVASARQPPLCE